MGMRFSTDRMALLAIDLQTGFCHPGGSSARRGRDITPMKNAAEKSLALVQHARTAGLPVIWTTITFHPQYRDGGLLTGALRPAIAERGGLKRGSEDGALMPGIDVRPEDYVVDKPRNSAFYASSLEAILHSARIESLLVCGVTTAMCVESTVRDAFQRDYAPFVVSDCTAEFVPARHEAALSAMAYGFANVLTFDEAVANLQRREFVFHPGTPN
jgi:ureidoacrylate peracid hydrolase